MKRAKKPPPPEVALEASVFADIIALDRDRPISEDHQARIDQLVELAMSEYMRLFKVRKVDSFPLHVPMIGDEADYQCLFCRKSLNTLPGGKRPNEAFMKTVLRHANECGVRLLAGLMTPHEPLPQGERGR